VNCYGIAAIKTYLQRHAAVGDPLAHATLRLVESQLAMNGEINAAYRDLRLKYNALVAELQDLQDELAASGLGATNARTMKGAFSPVDSARAHTEHNEDTTGRPQPGGE